MRTPRIITGLVTVGMLGLAPLAIAAPAQAAAVNTSATLETSATKVIYGDKISVSGKVSGVDAATGAAKYVSTGTVTLQMATAANPTWVTVGTSDSPGYYYFSDLKATANTQFKVLYSGGASTSDTYTPSESAPLSVGVTRKVSIKKGSGTNLTIKVKPKYAKKKIKIQVKKNGKYKAYKTVKTSKKSAAKVHLPVKRGGGKIYFKIIVPGDSQFIGYSEIWYTYSFDQAPLQRA